MAYTKYRAAWADASGHQVNAAFLNQLEQGVFDLKTQAFTVKDYGALGDGVADDTAAIQAAINAASAAGGAIVFFPLGTYKVSSAGTMGGRAYGLLLKSGVTIQGGSGTGSVIKAANASNMDVMTTDRNVDSIGVGLRNLTIDGNHVNQTAGKFNLWLHRVTDLLIDNVLSINAYAWACRIDTCTRVRINGYQAVTSATGVAGGDGLHFVDTSQVTGGNIYIYTETDDAFIIEAISGNVSDYALSGIYVQPKHTTVSAGLRGVLLLGDAAVMSAARTISNINLSSVVVKNSYGPAVNLAGASYKNVKISSVSDSCTNDLYLSPGVAAYPGKLQNCSFDVVGTNSTSTSIVSIAANGTFRGNKINAMVSNPPDNGVGVTLEGDYWTGSLAVDYDPNATKVSKQQCILIYGSFNSLDLQARDADTNILMMGTAMDNMIRLGAITGAVSFDVGLISGALRNRFFGGSVTKPTFGTVDGSNRFINVKGISVSSTTLTYAATISTDASKGDDFLITATNGTAFTISTPTNPTEGQKISYTISNTSGGALGVVTWGAGFKMAAWTSPATAFNRAITFRYNGTSWYEFSRTPADVPN